MNRTTQILAALLAFTAAATVAHLIGPWWALGSLACSVLPLLSLISAVALWQPWYQQWVELDFRPDSRPILLLTVVVEAGAIALWLAAPWLGLAARFIGMLAQLALVGKYRMAITPHDPDHNDKPARSKILN